MKKARIAIAVVMIILLGGAWLAQGFSLIGNTSAYGNALKSAETFMDKGLYQKAISSYNTALEIHDRQDLREKWIEAYQLGFEDNVVTKQDFARAMDTLCEKYPKEVKYWESLLGFYIDVADYNNGRSAASRCLRSGAKSDTLTKMMNTINYSYTTSGHTYRDVAVSPFGYITVNDEMNWGVMEKDSNWAYENTFLYCSPSDNNGTIVLSTEKDARVVDAEGVVQYIFQDKIAHARAYGDGLIPVEVSEMEKDEQREALILELTAAAEKAKEAADKEAANADEDAAENEQAADQKEETKLTEEEQEALRKELEKEAEQELDEKYPPSWSFYDCEKQQFRKGTYLDASGFVDGTAAVKVKDDQWTLIDRDEKKVSDTVFSDVKLLSNGAYAYKDIMVAAEKGKFGLYHADGSLIESVDAKDMDACYGSLIAFQNSKGKWGFVDSKGKVVIEPAFNEARSFSNGLAAVSNGETWGFINEAGQLVIDYQFDNALYFTSKGICLVSEYEDLYYVLRLRYA